MKSITIEMDVGTDPRHLNELNNKIESNKKGSTNLSFDSRVLTR